MSRNRDIKFLHEFTGLPYSVCRRRMKACGWDLMKALGIDTVKEMIEVMPDIIDNLGKAMNRFLAGLGTALKTIGQNLEETYGELEVKPIMIGEDANHIKKADLKGGAELYREETCKSKGRCDDYKYWHCVGCNGCKKGGAENDRR